MTGSALRKIAVVLCVASGLTVGARADDPATDAGAEGVSPPKAIAESKVPPKYPSKARRAGIAGRCILRPVITKQGSVGPIKVLECTYVNKDGSTELSTSPLPEDKHGFAQAAVDAVKKWRYEPAMFHGERVNVYINVTVEFALE